MARRSVRDHIDDIGVARLARMVNLTSQAVSQWKRRNQIPAHLVRLIERRTQGKPWAKTRYQLAPEVFGTRP